MMKARRIAHIASVAALATTLAAAAHADEVSIVAHTGAAGGLYMEPTVVWVEQWRQEAPGISVSPTPGGSMTNPITVSTSSEANVLGWTSLPLARDAAEGRGDYEERLPGGVDNLRALWRVNALTWGDIFARPGVVPDNVTTLGDFLATEPAVHWILKSRGSGAETMTRAMLEVHDVSYDDLREWGGQVSFMDTSDAARMIIDGHGDIMIDAFPMPASPMLDIDASVPNLKWLQLDEDKAAELADDYGYIAADHPTGEYSSLGDGHLTVAYDHLVFVRAEMDEEVVYQMAKSILGNPGRTQTMPQLSDFDPEIAGTQTVFPLHPGAERAYKELGLID